MRIYGISLVALTALAPALADSPPAAALVAAPATAVVQPIAAGQRLIRLPALDYTITVDADCGEQLAANSASLSIADTSVTIGTTALAEPVVNVQLTVPGAQVAPVAVENFCEAGRAVEGEVLATRVDDAVIAHLSVRCANADQQTIIYASKPLGVTIECARDQAPSDSSAAR